MSEGFDEGWPKKVTTHNQRKGEKVVKPPFSA